MWMVRKHKKQTYYDGATLNGGHYVSQMANDKWNGHGAYTWPSGNKYVGEWPDGKRNGQGTHTWPKGQKYVGEWRGFYGGIRWLNGNSD